MIEQKETGTNLESLMNTLANKDGIIRQKAREELVALGNPAVPFLTHALLNTGSIPPLVKALEDSNAAVAWLAADALKNYNKATSEKDEQKQDTRSSGRLLFVAVISDSYAVDRAKNRAKGLFYQL